MDRRWFQAGLGLALLSCGAAPAREPWATRAGSSAREPQAEPAPRAGADLRETIAQCLADQGALERFYSVEGSPQRIARLRRAATEWLAALDGADFDALAREAQVDWLLLRARLRGELAELDLEERRALEVLPLVPYAPRIVALAEARQRVEPVDPAETAGELDALRRAIDDEKKRIEETPPAVSAAVGNRAARAADELRDALRGWYDFRAGYDPIFTWWNAKPHEALRAALESHAKLVREKLAGRKQDDRETILGDPIGREALVEQLARAWIAYSPEELLEIGAREYAWCEAEMKKAAAEMDLGDDWKQALERVKQDHVAPGEQPALIQALAREAADYVEANELVTVPPLCLEVGRMNMLSPEQQRTSPFFLGGESILVSFPTDEMAHEEKRMSLRGNNRHFCRATVHHEVVPGHHLQSFMTERHFPYRRAFGTPFWTEGWALWWEMLLFERGFFATPEDRVGALFWRMHRCARIEFSLRFQLGEWSPAQCIDFLVERVGHERENAEAEVRRSFEGGYGPLYQLAYMIGALQFRALHAELVSSGRMSARAFHDAVLRGGNMPVAMVRARLAELPLSRDFAADWRFYPLDGEGK